MAQSPRTSRDDDAQPRPSHDTLSSVSTTSLVFDRLQEETEKEPADRRKGTNGRYTDDDAFGDDDYASTDPETGPFLAGKNAHLQRKPMDTSLKRILTIVAVVFVGGWVAALVVFLMSGGYQHASDKEHDPDAGSRGSGKAVTLDQVLTGFWYPRTQSISWIASPDGEDGLLLEQGASGKDYLIVEDVRSSKGTGTQDPSAKLAETRTLMKKATFLHNGYNYDPAWLKPSPDLKKVLLAVKQEKNWRHSFTAIYFIFDVETQTAEPLVPLDDGARIQLATWSPQSDAIAFTRDNNMFVRRISGKGKQLVQITRDGGPEYFYGIPDWVYEEEVFSGNSATWWSEDGKFLAFLRTNETGVPEYPIQYFRSRPSGKQPLTGEETYPDVVNIKYPKAGAHNPTVDLQVYDVEKGDVFDVPTENEFPSEDRIINNILFAGNKILMKQTNRVSDILKVILIDVNDRIGRIINTINVNDIDGGWFEISHTMTYIPANPSKGRPHDGYVDTIIHEGYDHLAYFTPLDNKNPIMLTSGPWEVEDAPSAVDLANNLVYFVATKESSIQRHVYSVTLNGTSLKPLTPTSSEGYYDVSFSSLASFALLSYRGPKIPYQAVISTPSSPITYNQTIESNPALAAAAQAHQLPLLKYGTIALSQNTSINYLERRPPHFNPKKKYPVLFQQYSGPGSQQVSKKFSVDFQSYVASSLGYVVVTVDPRGTGFLGRKHRVVVRNQLGLTEAQDHIAAAKHFAARDYVDPHRLAIWGWSYGGFQTLKTLEQDAGQTFSYGMAVAPVTDWRYYDSIYTERYMRLPQDNAQGYDASRISNASALAQNKRFLIMHGSADDSMSTTHSITNSTNIS